MRERPRERGFTLIDTLAVVGVLGLLIAVAVPSTDSSMRAFRLKGDARMVSNLVSLARIRAASGFTRARVYVDLARNDYSLETWDRTGNLWVSDQGVNTTSTGVTFGFSKLPTPPPNTQPVIALPPACIDAKGAVIAGTACVTFNSRGVPVDAAGAPTGKNALYITDGIGVYATTVTATPLVRSWWSPATSAKWIKR